MSDRSYRKSRYESRGRSRSPESRHYKSRNRSPASKSPILSKHRESHKLHKRDGKNEQSSQAMFSIPPPEQGLPTLEIALNDPKYVELYLYHYSKMNAKINNLLSSILTDQTKIQ